MAKTYAESVKLPNLVSVPHPTTKYLAKSGLNVEGRASLTDASFTTTSSSLSFMKNKNRKSYITALLETDENKKSKKSSASIHVNSEQVMELINDKLYTGYHGVRHLFKSNETSKDGRLTREAFKYVIIQLCGYISNDAWNKISHRFNLTDRDTISFEEFISHFRNNQKVKREMAASLKNLDLVNVNTTPIINAEPSLAKKSAIPELSATYCYALIKARARQSDFDPGDYLPEECFKNNGLVMPFHLKNLLTVLNLELSEMEFNKLWERFDFNNVGGVKLPVFLRLINYRPNHLDDLTFTMDLVRTRSCIVDKLNVKPNANKHSYSYFKSSHMPSGGTFRSSTTNLTNKPASLMDAKIEPTVNEPQPQSQQQEQSESDDECIQIENEKKNKFLKSKSTLDERSLCTSRESARKQTRQRQTSACESSLSETQIKSMVHILKNSNKFGPAHDLVAFLNNKLNEGYILLKTAFEYIDPDHFGHLLVDEFKIVLAEFNILMDTKVYENFIKKYELLKQNQLVDYQKFLKIFQEQRLRAGENKNESVASSESNHIMKHVEKQIYDFFHSSYFAVHNYFNESIGDGQKKCAVDMLKRLIEQKFAILIDSDQFESLLKFLNHPQTNSDSIEWEEMLRKFSEIDPWKNFRDSCDRTMTRTRSVPINHSRNSNMSIKSTSSSLNLNDRHKSPSGGKSAGLKRDTSLVKIDEHEQQLVSDEESDQEREIKLLCHSDSEDEHFTINKYFQSMAATGSLNLKNTHELRKNFEKEVKIIKKLEKKIERVFRTQFHSINKIFSLIDVHHTEKIDKQKCQILLSRLKINLDQNEIDLLWKDFGGADLIPFSNFVRRFFIPVEFDKLRNIKFKIALEEKLNQNARKKKEATKNRPEKEADCSSSTDLYDERTLNSRLDANIGNRKLLNKIKITMDEWNEMKHLFQRKDKNSRACISNQKALEVLEHFKIKLTSDDLNQLYRDYELNECDFDYIRFLKHLKSHLSATWKHRRDSPSKTTTVYKNLDPTLNKIILKLRDFYHNAESSNQNESDLKNLKNAFKKFDTSRKGYLNQNELKQLLGTYHIKINADEMYMIMAQYDPNLNGSFCYDLLIKSLIEK